MGLLADFNYQNQLTYSPSTATSSVYSPTSTDSRQASIVFNPSFSIGSPGSQQNPNISTPQTASLRTDPSVVTSPSAVSKPSTSASTSSSDIFMLAIIGVIAIGGIYLFTKSDKKQIALKGVGF